MHIKTVEDAYDVIVKAANVEGEKLPSFEEFQKALIKY